MVGVAVAVGPAVRVVPPPRFQPQAYRAANPNPALSTRTTKRKRPEQLMICNHLRKTTRIMAA